MPGYLRLYLIKSRGNFTPVTGVVLFSVKRSIRPRCARPDPDAPPARLPHRISRRATDVRSASRFEIVVRGTRIVVRERKMGGCLRELGQPLHDGLNRSFAASRWVVRFSPAARSARTRLVRDGYTDGFPRRFCPAYASRATIAFATKANVRNMATPTQAPSANDSFAYKPISTPSPIIAPPRTRKARMP
jgi:hypothetical protein